MNKSGQWWLKRASNNNWSCLSRFQQECMLLCWVWQLLRPARRGGMECGTDTQVLQGWMEKLVARLRGGLRDNSSRSQMQEQDQMSSNTQDDLAQSGWTPGKKAAPGDTNILGDILSLWQRKLWEANQACEVLSGVAQGVLSGALGNWHPARGCYSSKVQELRPQHHQYCLWSSPQGGPEPLPTDKGENLPWRGPEAREMNEPNL